MEDQIEVIQEVEEKEPSIDIDELINQKVNEKWENEKDKLKEAIISEYLRPKFNDEDIKEKVVVKKKERSLDF